ncbi:MAG: hypothetical protein WBO93_08505 [Gammaproteobacteria bacterium]
MPYVITFMSSNSLAAALQDFYFVDILPISSKDLAGQSGIENVPADHMTSSMQMSWPVVTNYTDERRHSIDLPEHGAGVSDMEPAHMAQVFDNRTDTPATGQATDTVRSLSVPTFDCTDVIGKVFDDSNLNGYQDEGEAGLPSAKVITASGLEATTDARGRFHITCALAPNLDHGSNIVIKLDLRSLPTGYRLTTENPRVGCATRGKILKFNFGAAMHRVVRLDLADAVFEPNSKQISPRWFPQVSLLMDKLVEAPSVLYLVYTAEVEQKALVNDRVKGVKKEIERRWADLDCCYKLDIETEIIQRIGKSVD